ncbi:MAG: PKD domain-containing protein, partial [Bacteroidales bacterium]|nr:PKD domain-containing protein [Bacteroidales bacterium]
MKKGVLFLFLMIWCLYMTAQKASFTYNQPSQCVPSTVTFTNTGTGTPISFLWDFGDNNSTSSVYHPVHPFTAPGVYTVTLIMRYANSTDTSRQTITVLNVPSFSFTKLNDSVCPGDAVSFSSSVSYPSNPAQIQSYAWDFGDGGQSLLPNPTWTYQNIANLAVRYAVSLTVTDVNGCSNKITQSDYVAVKRKPVVDFSSDKQVFCYS